VVLGHIRKILNAEIEKAWEEKEDIAYFFDASRFLIRRLYEWHLRHFFALKSLRAPHFRQIW
jgi:hypothetical protein